MTGLSWFRQDAMCANAPEVGRLARKLGIPRAHALGCITAIEAQLSAHAPDGNLEPVLDMLVDWVSWDGDPDAFVAAIVSAVTGGTKIMTSWLEKNCGPMGDAERARNRMRRYRERKRSGESGPDSGDDWEQTRDGSAFSAAFHKHERSP